MTFNQSHLALSIALIASVPNAFADQLQSEIYELEARELKVNETIQKLYQLESAVTSYFLEKGGFPANLSDITSGTKPFFNGSLRTSIGEFSSKVTSNSFELVFKPRDATNDRQVEMMAYIASLTASEVQGTSFEYFIPAPQSTAIVNNMLNRVDSSANGNRMLTDLSMGGNDITDIKKLFTDKLELTNSLTLDNLNATSVTLEQLTSATRLTASGNTALGNANFTDFTVNSDGTVNNFTIKNLVSTNEATGNDVKTDSFNSAKMSVVDAFIDELNGDTATIESALFTQSTTASIFNVSQRLETDLVEVDVIRGYNSVPIEFTGSAAFGDVSLNAPLELRNGMITNGNAKLADTTVQSLDLRGKLVGTNIDVARNLIARGAVNITRGARIDGNLNGRDVFATNADFTSTVSVGNNVQVTGSLKVGNSIRQGGRLLSTGTTLYNNGSSLSSLLLGKNATAYDADKIDNYDSSQLAQRNQANTFGGTQTFKNTVNVSGNVYVNGRLVVDSSGNLYDGGQAIKNIYSSKTDAGTMYAKWDNEIAQLRSSLSGDYNSLSSYASGVKGSLSTAQAKANAQKNTLNSLESTYASVNNTRNVVNTKISQLSSARSSENAKLVSAVSKLDAGPTYTSRSCQIVTTRTETAVDSGRFTTSVSDGCGSKATTQYKTAQYGTLK
ncbi:TPA: hypothetical protein ACN976_000420 [Vibrio campbellii]